MLGTRLGRQIPGRLLQLKGDVRRQASRSCASQTWCRGKAQPRLVIAAPPTQRRALPSRRDVNHREGSCSGNTPLAGEQEQELRLFRRMRATATTPHACCTTNLAQRQQWTKHIVLRQAAGTAIIDPPPCDTKNTAHGVCNPSKPKNNTQDHTHTTTTQFSADSVHNTENQTQIPAQLPASGIRPTRVWHPQGRLVRLTRQGCRVGRKT